MILSASGWRKIFAASEEEQDKTQDIGETNRALCALIAETFAEYIVKASGKETPIVAVGTDTRPTGKQIADAVIRVLLYKNIGVQFLGVTAAPEIMAYSKSIDGFLYISASHNPVGHNGIKFGLNDGGVLNGTENAKLIEVFKEKCADPDAMSYAEALLTAETQQNVDLVYALSDQHKKEALWAYEDFIRIVITGTNNTHSQDKILDKIRNGIDRSPLSIVCDMNGSARTRSIDSQFLSRTGINFLPFNNEAGHIAHAIIPEPENLIYCAEVMEELRKDGEQNVDLAYMPDCDGDRGNLVYWDEEINSAKPIPAQEVFALCVIAESTFDIWKENMVSQKSLLMKAERIVNKNAVAVNCPTSMRIDEICEKLGRKLFRAEVGEANVVNLAREKREEGYTVRILGEGSNGGNITYPSSVRDPLATVMAMVKLLTIRDEFDEAAQTTSKGLFHIWCERSKQEYKYRDDFTLCDILDTLPKYTTTGVSEDRAILNVRTQDKGELKECFKKIFIDEWAKNWEEMKAIYGIFSYRVFLTNGTKETLVSDYDSWNNKNGGLKVQFLDKDGIPTAFIWMRPSGTEPVFRVMCDTKKGGDSAERSLLRWETSMIKKADSMLSPEE